MSRYYLLSLYTVSNYGMLCWTALPIKKHIQPKYRLPVLNWVAMKPNQVKGTLFSELDDEKLYNVSCTFCLALDDCTECDYWNNILMIPAGRTCKNYKHWYLCHGVFSRPWRNQNWHRLNYINFCHNGEDD